jgi:beta-galactosidase
MNNNPIGSQFSPTAREQNISSNIRVDSSGLSVEVHNIPLCSGSLHYWRHSPEIWQHLLEQIKGLGFGIIQTPIPWNVHEINPGEYDFGEKNPQRDITRFLNLCRDVGLSAILNLGPCLEEDLPAGGFPPRIIKNSSFLAHTSTGAPLLSSLVNPPMVVPSYASEKFYLEEAAFFDALIPLIKPHLSPKGPVVLCTVKKESTFYGRRGAYDVDYSKDAIALYGKFLAEKYSSIEALNKTYGKKHLAFSEVLPPRKISDTEKQDLSYSLDWMEFKEYLIRHSLQRFTMMIRERGLNVPLAVDGPPDITSPVDAFAWQSIPEISLCGIEIDPRRQDYGSLARSARYLSGTRSLAWASTFGSGCSWASNSLPTPVEEEFAILVSIMHGMSAVNFHMLVESNGWMGAPITRDGAYRKEFADLFRRLNDFLSRNQVWESQKVARVLVLLPFNMERFNRFIHSMDQVFLGLLGVPESFSDAHTTREFPSEYARQTVLAKNEWISAIFQCLEQVHVEYNIADTHAPQDVLNKYAMIFLPTADLLEAQEQEKLLAYMDHGGHLVLGSSMSVPNASAFSSSMLAKHIQEPGSKPYGAGRITLLPSPEAESVSKIIRPDIAHPIVPDNPKVRLTIRQGASSLVFLANPTAEEQETKLKTPWPLRGIWNATGTKQGDAINITIKPLSVQVWEVVK